MDWIATISSLLGYYFGGNQNRIGFVLLMAASFSWLGFGILTGSKAMIIGGSIFVLLHSRAFRNLRKIGETIDD